MSTTNYEELYGVKLLDDLHNYFPALLYDTARFQSVRDVLGYITQNTRNRFDLFSFGQRNYMHTSIPQQVPEQPPPLIRATRPTRSVDMSGEVPFHQPGAVNYPAANSYANVVARGIPSNNPLTASFEMYTDDLELPSVGLMNLVSLLSGLPAVSGAGLRAPRVNMEDVVVSATEREIEEASTRSFPEVDTVCSICQDNIGTNEMGRKLNHCGHTFHIRCIDTWFSRNVRCPICRHDIRETGAGEGVSEEERD